MSVVDPDSPKDFGEGRAIEGEVWPCEADMDEDGRSGSERDYAKGGMYHAVYRAYGVLIPIQSYTLSEAYQYPI